MNGLGYCPKIIAVPVLVNVVFDKTWANCFQLLSDYADLCMRCVRRVCLVVVIANLDRLDVIPLGIGVNNVFFQLAVLNAAIVVVGVLRITVAF